jgi:gas vesicle protein GvpN
MSGNSSRKRKVRGRRRRSSQEEKELSRFSGEHSGDGPSPEEVPDPDEVAGPFVETDEVAALRDRVDRWLDAEQPVHLIGPTGCGKTSLALNTAAQRDRPVVWVTGDESLTTADLVGEQAGKEQYVERDQFVSNVVKKKSIVRDRWVDNPLTVAVREGATLVYNEFSRTKPVANNALLEVFEEGVLDPPGKRGENNRIDVHPGFRAVLVSNSTEYAAVHRPQDALLDRLVAVHMDFYGPETETEIVAAHVDLDRDQVEEIVGIVQTLRDELDVTVGTRAAVTIARGIAAFGDDASMTEITTDVVGSKVTRREDIERLREQIDAVM